MLEKAKVSIVTEKGVKAYNSIEKSIKAVKDNLKKTIKKKKRKDPRFTKCIKDILDQARRFF